MKALQRMGRSAPTDAGEQLADVRCPALVVEGTLDPDWADPRVEGEAIVAAHARRTRPARGGRRRGPLPAHPVPRRDGRAAPARSSRRTRVPRAGLDPAVVVAGAAGLADEIGLHHVTMGLLAERLGVRAPSLYKHVDEQADLNRRIAVLALTELGDALRDALQGRAARTHCRLRPARSGPS